MNDDSRSMGVAFSRWQLLTDEYAKSLQALERGDRHSVKNLDRIARALAQRLSSAPHLPTTSHEEPGVRWTPWRKAVASLRAGSGAAAHR